MLDDGADRSVALVVAPAGYGKSVLVSQWLDTLDGESCWLSLDEADTDLRRFGAHLVAAIRQVAPGFGGRTLAMLNGQADPRPGAIAESLATEIDSLPSPVRLVLDDYHRLSSGDVPRVIHALLDPPPVRLSLVIVSRRDPALRIDRLRLQGDLVDVRLKDLQFDADETVEFLRRAGVTHLDGEQVGNLARATEGWPAGLRLVSLALRRVPDPGQLIQSLSAGVGSVQRYLVGEVLEGLSPTLRERLAAASLLDRFCAALVESMVVADGDGKADAAAGAEFTAILAAGEMFVIGLDAQGRWYRFHHMFQQLLREHLEHATAPEQVRALLLRVSDWHAAQDNVEEAIRYALEAGADDLAADLVERRRHEMLDRDDLSGLRRLLSLLPERVVASRPGLLAARGWVAHYTLHIDAILRAADSAAELLTTSSPEGLRAEIAGLRGNALYLTGDPQAAEAALSPWVAKIPSNWYHAQSEIQLHWCLSLQGIGRGEQAARWLEEQLLATPTDQPLARARYWVGLAFMQLIEGRLTRSLANAMHLQVLGANAGLEYVEGWARYVMALIYLRRHELGAAASHVEWVRANPEQQGFRVTIDSLAAEAWIADRRGDTAAADARVRELRRFALTHDDARAACIVRSLAIRIALRRGVDRKDLVAMPEPAWRMDSGHPLWWFESPRLTHARFLFAVGGAARSGEAAETLEAHARFAESIRDTYHLIDALVVLASGYASQGRDADARATLGRALGLAAPGHHVQPFLDGFPGMRDLMAQIDPATGTADLRYAIESALAVPDRGAIAEPAGGARAHGSQSGDTLVDPLTVREEEVLELLVIRLRDKEIAEELGVSPLTVKTHLGNLYSKLGVHGRREAVARARAVGLVEPPS